MTAPATNEPASIFVSLELSKRSWLTATLKPGTDRVSIRTFPGGDAGALLTYLSSLRSQVQAAIGGAAVVKLCYEVGYDGFWLARLLKDEGFEPYVLDPASFLVSRRGKRVKPTVSTPRRWSGFSNLMLGVILPFAVLFECRRPRRRTPSG